MAEEKLVATLETLIDTCRDGEKGFREAAEHVSDPEVRAFFTDQSAERGAFAEELEHALGMLGKRPGKREGTVAGTLHRVWSDVKSRLGGGDVSVLETVEAAEDSAKEAFEKALWEDLPENIRTVVAKQAVSVRAAHDDVRLMRDRRKKAA